MLLSRSLLSALFAGCTLAGASAQEAQPPAGEPGHFAVIGLAPDDLLNLRATASASGMLIGRLPMGVLVKNLGCADVKDVRWCKVGDLDNPQVQGWAAARYLQPAEGPPDDIGPVGEDLEEPSE